VGPMDVERRKSVTPPGFEPLTVHLVTTCWTNYPVVSSYPFLREWNLVFTRESSNKNFSNTLLSTSRSSNCSLYSKTFDRGFKINKS
jgi:hypothetical protein